MILNVKAQTLAEAFQYVKNATGKSYTVVTVIRVL